MKYQWKTLTALGVAVALGTTVYGVASFADSDDHERRSHHEYRHGSHDYHGRHAMRGMRMLEHYDSNSDGALTRSEIEETRNKQFAAFDANGDGVLELAEYQNLWLDAMRERMVDRFQKHDHDGDGKITAEDYSRSIKRKMAWMDRNGDGKVDREDHRRRHDED